MKKIYTHLNLVSLFDQSAAQFKSAEELPYNCDFVAFTIFDNSVTHFESVVQQLLSKSKHVLIDLNEPTDKDLVALADNLMELYKNLYVCSAIIPNYPSKIVFSGNWFMSSINFYSYNSSSAWANNFLSHNDTDFQHKLFSFDCLLGCQRPVRDQIEQLYNKSLVRDKIIFNYYKDNIQNGLWDFPINTVSHSSQLVEHNNELFTPSAAIPYSVYNQSNYSIVAETLDYNSYSFFTEKIVKPILAKRLFVVFAGQYYLQNLKKLGFKTFDNIIDESYDFESDCNQRIQQAWRQVEYLTTLDPEKVAIDTKSIREHNYHLFRSTKWNQGIIDIINQTTGSNFSCSNGPT